MLDPTILAVDVFAAIMLTIVVGLIIVFLLLGAFYPGTGAEQIGWRPTRSAEVEVQNDIDDLEQMFDAANARRRRKGLPDLHLADVEQSTRDFQREQLARSASYGAGPDSAADEEIAQMLERVNARRARKGLQPFTREQYEASLTEGA